MPDLSTINGASLVPDLSNALKTALGGLELGRERRAEQEALEAQAEQAQQQTVDSQTVLTSKDSEAVAAAKARIAQKNPPLLNALETSLKNQDERQRQQVQDFNNERLRFASKFKKLSPDKVPLEARKALTEVATKFNIPVEQLQDGPLMKLANEQNSDKIGLLIDNMVSESIDIKTIADSFTPQTEEEKLIEAGLLTQDEARDKALGVKSEKEFSQDIQLAQAQATAAQEVANRSPQARLQIQLSEQALEAAKEERLRNEEAAERSSKKFAAKQRKAERGVKAAIIEVDSFIETIDELLGNENLADAFGLVGAAAANKPGSNSATIREKIKQLESKSGFKSLVELKAQGGTLGALSGTELDLLVAQKGVLSTKQDVKTFIKEITNMREDLLGARTRLNDEFEIEFGDPDKAFSNQTTTIGEFEVKVVR